ncbi:MAG: hypothetical protein ACYSUK_04300 [Planctomycetota bacterium]|jgi:hypothetical protein
MKKICLNCKFFVPSKSPLIRDDWGECIKPGIKIKRFAGKIQGDFAWADSNCGDFDATKDRELAS